MGELTDKTIETLTAESTDDSGITTTTTSYGTGDFKDDVLVNTFKVTQTFNIQGVEVFAEGTWNGDKYTADDLDAMVTAFSEAGVEPPLKLGHNSEQEKDGQPAFGWVGKVYREGKKLLADFKDLPLTVYEAIKRGNYKKISSEIYWNFTRGDKVFPRVLKAVALLGADIPAVSDIAAIEGLYKQDTGDVRFYFKDSLEPGKGKAKQQEEQDMEKVEELQETISNLKQEHETLEAKYSEIKEAKKKADDKLVEQQAEIKADQTKNFISEQKADGRVLPRFEAELEALFNSATDTKVYTYTDDDSKKVELSQTELIEKIVKALPKLIEFEEQAEDASMEDVGDYDTAPDVEVDRRAKILMDKEKAKTYDEAVEIVLEKDSELKKSYIGGK